MEERLQKILAQSGLGSRRDCESFIITGRVQVNGVTAIIGQKADPAVDKICLDGRPVKPPQEKIYVALHKPRNVLTAVEAEAGDSRRTVRDLVPVSERLYPVGRLDFDSEGLVLMTNDGDMAQKLTHPSHGHQKEYRILLARQPDDEQLATWRRGVVLEDGYKTIPAEVRIEGSAGKGCWVRVVMQEGRKRQIREIGSLLGLPVVRIVRIRIGSLQLGALKPGEWRYLSRTEVEALKAEPQKDNAPARVFRPRRDSFPKRREQRSEQRPEKRSDQRAEKRSDQRPEQRPEKRSEKRPDSTGRPHSNFPSKRNGRDR
jgi:23S rRNA pseudouridine2605 synthase